MTNRDKMVGKALAAFLFASVSSVAIDAAAQTSTDTQSAGRLDEIVVTARKRKESLQDVPISVQAINGKVIDEQGLSDLASLAPYTPNFSMMQAPGASDMFFMRGLGTFGSGIHFEPSVGQVFNGYFSTRSRLARTALIDVSQVEVLKGPQGAIIGKNTSLGALNITSNGPTDTFEGSLSLAYNFEASEGYESQAILSGPLSDRVRARVVVDYQNVDGWIKDRETGKTLEQKEDLTFRGMLDVDITSSLTASLLYQYNNLDRNGKTREIIDCFPAGLLPRTRVTGQDLGFDCSLNGSNQTRNVQRASENGPVLDIGEPFKTEAHVFGATLDWDFDSFSVTSLSNYTTYDTSDNFSGDLLPTERVNIQNNESYDQFYQEVRATSNGDGVFDWIVGGTYFNGDLEFSQFFNHLFANRGGPIARNEFARSNTESFAGFGQIDYQFNDQFSITLGARITNEDRTGAKAQGPTTIYTPPANLLDNPLPVSPGIRCGGGFAACTNGDATAITGKITDTNVSYNGSVQYRPDGDNMFYASFATGFKSGGFDLRGAGNAANFIFPNEQSTNYEIGGKHNFGGNFRFNWTLFRLEVDDLQVSTNDPVFIQQIVGAAQVHSQGLEVDAAWAPTDALNITFSGAYLDAKFDQFTSGCFARQTVATGCIAGQFAQDGLSPPQAPDLQTALSADYTVLMNDDVDLVFGGTWTYVDGFHTALERSLASFQSGVNRFDASVTLRGTTAQNREWTLALIARNLTDKRVLGFCNTSSLSGAGALVCSHEETRFISLRAGVNF
ncbi:MAG: hypothetical protein COA84_07425 [Robiginitomaculum sp.]|nr:MAG: hypothetical protein COA84_07425 [Robiginitomaculum sp.]